MGYLVCTMCVNRHPQWLPFRCRTGSRLGFATLWCIMTTEYRIWHAALYLCLAKRHWRAMHAEYGWYGECLYYKVNHV